MSERVEEVEKAPLLFNNLRMNLELLEPFLQEMDMRVSLHEERLDKLEAAVAKLVQSVEKHEKVVDALRTDMLSNMTRANETVQLALAMYRYGGAGFSSYLHGGTVRVYFQAFLLKGFLL